MNITDRYAEAAAELITALAQEAPVRAEEVAAAHGVPVGSLARRLWGRLTYHFLACTGLTEVLPPAGVTLPAEDALVMVDGRVQTLRAFLDQHAEDPVLCAAVLQGRVGETLRMDGGTVQRLGVL